MSLIRQFAIRNELLYSGFVLPNVQIFLVQKISFATFRVSIDDFFTRYAGLGYSLYLLLAGFCLFVFVALRPMSTAMVIAGRSVHLTTLFPGQA